MDYRFLERGSQFNWASHTGADSVCPCGVARLNASPVQFLKASAKCRQSRILSKKQEMIQENGCSHLFFLLPESAP